MFPVIATILVLLILFLAIPVDLLLALKKEDRWQGRIVVYSLFGRVRTNIRVGRRRRGNRGSLKKTGKQLFRQRRRLSAMLRSEGFLRASVSLIVKLVRMLRPRRFRLQCVVGLDNPAATGRLMGLLAPLKAVAGAMKFGRSSNISVRIAPDFSQERFTGYLCSSVHFVPLKLIGVLLGFLFSAPVLRAVRAAMLKSAPYSGSGKA